MAENISVAYFEGRLTGVSNVDFSHVAFRDASGSGRN